MYIHTQKIINAILEYSIKSIHFAPQESQREDQTQSQSEEKRKIDGEGSLPETETGELYHLQCALLSSKLCRKEMHRIDDICQDKVTGVTRRLLTREMYWAKRPSVINLG